jgi:hypothetical protein
MPCLICIYSEVTTPEMLPCIYNTFVSLSVTIIIVVQSVQLHLRVHLSTKTSKNDITMVQRKVDANDTMNQTRHLLSLLTMVLQSIIDGCIPELQEIRKLNAFLSSSHYVHGRTSLSTNRLTYWIAHMCLGMQGNQPLSLLVIPISADVHPLLPTTTHSPNSLS